MPRRIASQPIRATRSKRTVIWSKMPRIVPSYSTETISKKRFAMVTMCSSGSISIHEKVNWSLDGEKVVDRADRGEGCEVRTRSGAHT